MQKKITRQTQYSHQPQILFNSRILACQKSNKNHFKNTHTAYLRENNSKKHSTSVKVFLNSQGSALVVGLTLLPLIVGSLLASFVMCWMIRAKNELLFNCERGLLRIQTQLVEAENQLQSLNSPIEKTVLQKKVLKKSLLAAKTPVEASLIKAQLILIEIKLAAFKKRQQILISTTNLKAQQDIFVVAQKTKSHLTVLQSQWSARLFSSTQNSMPRIQLVPQTIDPSAEIYITPPGFRSQQTLHLKWFLKGTHLFPSCFHFLKEKNFSWQDSCSSRPTKKETGLWTAEIGKGI